MTNENKKFYITTSIAYTNAPPHIGFALELVQADVLARFHRILGEDVFFLTGTDEHGFKIAETAEKAGKTPEVFVKEVSDKFEELTNILNISNDDFIRTTDKERHWPVVREVWKRLKENDDLSKKDYTGWYCKGCEAFITEKTGHEAGPVRCLVHDKECELVKEKNWFFKLSKDKYQNEIKQKIESDELKIIPETRKNEVLSILNQAWTELVGNELVTKKGLIDISFSRSAKKLKWGIPAPDDPSQKIYVWADALTNYISALGYPNGKKFERYWPADVQCIGKDILKFHALIWPAMLLSLKLRLPKTIFVHGFITANGQKMSKSSGNVVDPFELVNKYGADTVRYFLLREIPSTKDGDFTYDKLERRYNDDLAKGLGNLLSRVLTLKEKLSIKESTSPSPTIRSFIDTPKQKYNDAFENFNFSEALIAIWEIISNFDRYIDKEEPWRSGKNAIQVVSDSLFALEEISSLLEPFLPETAEKISRKLKAGRGKPLFPRLK